MKRILVLCLLFWGSFSTGVYGQKNVKALFAPRTASSFHKLSVQTSRALIKQQRLAQKMHSRQQLPAALQKALLTIKENQPVLRHMRLGTQTAFVIEDDFQGKKQLWGVSAAHGYLIKAALQDPQTEAKIPVSFATQSGLGDVALFPIPASVAPHVTPLPLAAKSAQKGEELYSVGFFGNQFHLETNRIVEEAGPHRIITRLDIDRSCMRSGACGGPLLNQAGQVVAVHVGSHNQKDLGYAVPVEKIYEALQDLHTGQMSAQPLVFNGKPLSSIARNQFIRAVRVYRDGKLLREKKTYLRENEIDYNHLENLIFYADADELEFSIAQNDFSTSRVQLPMRGYILTYNLATGQSSLRSNIREHPFCKRIKNKCKTLFSFGH